MDGVAEFFGLVAEGDASVDVDDGYVADFAGGDGHESLASALMVEFGAAQVNGCIALLRKSLTTGDTEEHGVRLIRYGIHNRGCGEWVVVADFLDGRRDDRGVVFGVVKFQVHAAAYVLQLEHGASPGGAGNGYVNRVGTEFGMAGD